MDSRSEKRMFGLNYIQLVLGVLITCGTVMVSFAAYITLPDQVKELKLEQTAAVEKAVKNEEKRSEDHELLVRIDERLKQVQLSVVKLEGDKKSALAASAH